MAIRITMTVERIGTYSIIRSASIRGHQQLQRDSLGLLCASVSFLFRTIANSLVNTPGIDVKLAYPQRGMLTIDIPSYSSDAVPMLGAIHNLVIQGVHDLKQEYAHEISLQTLPYNQ